MRILLFFILISAGSLVGCSADDVNETATDTNAPPANVPLEVSRANQENKLLLLEFGSSDACPPCMRFQREVFSTQVFKTYAATSLDFVRLDFPMNVNLHPDTVATNTLLAQQYDAYGFPTFIALGRDGKEFWRMPKKDNWEPDFEPLFNPTNFIQLMQKLRQEDK